MRTMLVGMTLLLALLGSGCSTSSGLGVSEATGLGTPFIGDVVSLGDWEVRIASVALNSDVRLHETVPEQNIGYVVTLELKVPKGVEEEAEILDNLSLEYVGVDENVYSNLDSFLSGGDLPDPVIEDGNAVWVTTIGFPASAAGNSHLYVRSIDSADAAMFDIDIDL